MPRQVLVEAESFSDKGGWVVDHQAFRPLHSCYLMAHGMGNRVADAKTKVRFPGRGTYNVYVSTYNWTAPWYDGAGPGAFTLSVGGVVMPDTLGTSGSVWHWQYAGKVKVKSRNVDISIHDLTGFNGRVDAIYFTDGEDRPDPDYSKFLTERSRLLGVAPEITVDGADLVVVGGGIAGCCTALTAARYGLDVVLVDNLPWLGGSNALGVRASGLMFKNLYPKLGLLTCQVTGAELSLKDDPKAYKVAPQGYGYLLDSSYREEMYQPVHDCRGSAFLDKMESLSSQGFKPVTDVEKDVYLQEYRRRNTSILRERLLREAGVRVYQNTQVYKTSVKDGKLVSVTGTELKTGRDVTFSGTLFADCTGDGTVGFLSGASWMIGRESRDYAGEPSAPELADNKMMGSSMRWFAIKRDEPSAFPCWEQIPWAMKVDDDYHIDSAVSKWWWETGMTIDNAENIEIVRDNFLRAVFGNWAYLKNNKKKYAKHTLDYLQYIAMKRESRRLVGDVILNQNDILQKRQFKDASFTTTWTMDLHYAKSDNSERYPGWEWITYCTHKEPLAKVDRFDVPYRCLYSKDIPNLFIGGRNMSVTHQALGTVRVQMTLGMAGEVTGMAARICKEHDCFPREVYVSYLDELKNLMIEGAPLD